MLFSSKLVAIFYITRSGIARVMVDVDSAAVVAKLQYVWSQTEELDFLFSFKNTKITEVLVLVADELCYQHTWELEPTAKRPSRAEVLVVMQERIPDILTDNWDYEIIKNNVLVVAYVSEFWTQLVNLCGQHNCTITASEPVFIAKKRHTNPLVGLARKLDSFAPDAESLTVSSVPSEHHTVIKGLAIVLVCLLIGLGVGVGVYQKFVVSPNLAPATPTPIPEITPAPTPTPLVIDPSVWKVHVLNGSGVTGEASRAAELLRGSGFTQLVTGNATPSAETTVSVQSLVPPEIIDAIATQLETQYTVSTQAGILDSEYQHHVVVVIGSNIKNEEGTP